MINRVISLILIIAFSGTACGMDQKRINIYFQDEDSKSKDKNLISVPFTFKEEYKHAPLIIFPEQDEKNLEEYQRIVSTRSRVNPIFSGSEYTISTKDETKKSENTRKKNKANLILFFS